MFGETLTAMVTPFKGDGEVDWETVKHLTEYLVQHGSQGLVVAGTTGESPTLTFEEKVQLFQVVKETVEGRATVIAGTGTNNTRTTIHLTREAEKAGVNGVMLVAPYYNKPPPDALYYHFAAVAESTSLPIILYNIPGRTGTNIPPETIIQLSRIPNIVALKQANGSMEETSIIQKNTPLDFYIYSGDDTLTLPFLSLGAEGVISVASHVAGERISQMISAYKTGDVKRAYQIHLELFPLFKGLFFVTNPIPVKGALEVLGVIPEAILRPPLRSPTATEKEKIQQMLKEAGVLPA